MPLKLAIRRGLDLLLYLTLCVMIGTGLLLVYKLPPRSQALEVIGWTRHEWGNFHMWISFLFVGLILVHLILNWSWLVKCAAKGHSWRIAAGLSTGGAIIAAFLLLPTPSHSSTRDQSTRSPRPATQKDPSGTKGVSYTKEIFPLLESSCISCHGAEKQRAGVRLDRRADLTASIDGQPPLVIPHESEKSPLIAIISGKIRLKKSAEDHLLPPDQVALIRKWIDDGAD